MSILNENDGLFGNLDLDKDLKNFYQNSISLSNSLSNSFSKNFSKAFLNKDNKNIPPKSEFAEPYHFLCKKCKTIPKIKFRTDNKIELECKCKPVIGVIDICKVFNFLDNSNDINIEFEKLICKEHNEKFVFYCNNKGCNKNLCLKCRYNCIKHQNKIKFIYIDEKIIKTIFIFIQEKLRPKIPNNINDNDFKQDIVNDDDKSFSEMELLSKEEEIHNKNEIKTLSKNKEGNINNNINNNVIKEGEITDIINDIDNNEDNNNELDFYYTNLFTIILNDYKDYPNYFLIQIISDIEKFVIYHEEIYNEIDLIYEIREEDVNLRYNSIKLFGYWFVNNNKENCFLIIEKKIFDLVSDIILDDIFKDFKGFNDESIILNVKLIEKKDKLMNNISFMFQEISTLSSDTNFNEFNTENIKYMNGLFYNCSSNNELPDISNFNTKNVVNMSYMFYNCNSLYSLPDISKWNTEKLLDASHMFQNCGSLWSLPDISKWNMNNVNKINEMFKNCEMLNNWPKLSRWKFKEDAERDNIFQGCILLDLMYDKYKGFGNIKKIVNTAHKVYTKLENPSSKICMLISIILSGILYIVPTYYSTKLNELNQFVSDPIKNFKLMNYFNISRIAEYKNISNLTIINEDKEAFINKELNFTNFNNNIKFEKSAYQIKIMGIFYGILGFIKFIIILFGNRFMLPKLEKFDNLTYIIIYLFIAFFVDICSLILEILIFNFTRSLEESFLLFIKQIKNLFWVHLDNSIFFLYIYSTIFMNIIFSILLMFHVIGSCRRYLNKKISTNTYLYNL